MERAFDCPAKRHAAEPLLLALEFLTVLRLRGPATVDAVALGRSQAFFPAVGLLLGALLALADWATSSVLGPALRGWLLMGLLVLLSGGLHVDGLADTADGLFGASTREDMLRIMRDSSIGAFGTAAIFAVLGIKATALGSLAGAAHREVLVVVPALARWTCVLAIAVFPYGRPQGLGSAFHANAWPWATPFAAAIALGAGLVLLGSEGIVFLALASATALLLGAGIQARLGGLTGDIYGAIVEVSETLLFVVAVAWWS